MTGKEEKTVVLYLSYGAWRTITKFHLFTRDGHRLCDGKRTRYGIEMGRAGSLEDATCKRCRAKLKQLRQKGVRVIEGWMVWE